MASRNEGHYSNKMILQKNCFRGLALKAVVIDEYLRRIQRSRRTSQRNAKVDVVYRRDYFELYNMVYKSLKDTIHANKTIN